MVKGPATAKRVGVLMGGLSAERDVSVRSGLAVYQALQEMGYNSVLIDVGKDIVNVLKKEKVKVAFLALHGGLGENGSIQGMLEVLNIPYTGSGVLASAVAMDKEASKKIFTFHGLKVAPYIALARPKKGKAAKRSGAGAPDVALPLPWVVKPSAEGSSIGVRIVRDGSALEGALEETFKLGGRALIEQFIEGREVHIGILGDTVLGGVEVRPTVEFYNYEAKYTSGLTEYILPPQLEEAEYERAMETALRAHQAIGCSGATRVDLIIDREGAPWVLEVNTLPGMTGTSLLPKIAASTGMDFKGLIEEILKLAVKKA